MAGAPQREETGALAASELEDAVDVWLAPVAGAEDAAALARCRVVLAPDEVARADAHLREADRRRVAVSRWLLRTTLSRYASREPSEWRFAQGEHGRPELVGPHAPHVRFNVAHTGDLVACAVTRRDAVGVDVERMDEATDLAELAETVFAADEVEGLRREPPSRLARRFYETWTLKEAYLKARGLGLSLSPRSVAFDLAEPGRASLRLEPGAGDAAGAWWFATADPWPRHVLALAWRRPAAPARLRFFRTEPGSTTATPLLVPLARRCEPSGATAGILRRTR